MVCLVIMLIGATIPFCNIGELPSDRPAIDLYQAYPFLLALNLEPIFAGILMCLSLFVPLYKLFESPSQSLSYYLDKYISKIPRWLIHGIAHLQTRLTRWNILLHMLVVQPFVACLILTKTYLFILSSKSFEVLKTEPASQMGILRLTVFQIFSIIVVAAYGTVRLLSIWDISSESPLTFGQVVPLAMLFGPFFILWDNFVGRWSSKRSNIRARSTNNGVDMSPTQLPDSISTPASPRMNPTGARTLYYEPLNSLNIAEPSPDTENIRLRRLIEAGEGSFCVISVLPLLRMTQGPQDCSQPYLGRFETLPWFPYLMPHLFAAGSLLATFASLGDGERLEIKLATEILAAMEMLLVLGMPSQILFILMWLRNMYSFGLGPRISAIHRELLYGCLSSLVVIGWNLGIGHGSRKWHL